MTVTAPSWGLELPQSPRRLAHRATHSRSLPHFTPRLASGGALIRARRVADRGVQRSSSPYVSGRQIALPDAGASIGVPPAAGYQRSSHRSRRGSVRSVRNTRPVRGSHHPRYGVIVAVAVLVAMFALIAPGISAEASRTVTESPAQSIVTVAPGDSLWSVATRSMPDTDPRSAVRELRVVNNLKGTALTPGQKLVVPSP